MSSNAYLYVKKCVKHGQPVEGECPLCEQEKRDHNKKLEQLHSEIVELVKSGKLSKEILGHN